MQAQRCFMRLLRLVGGAKESPVTHNARAKGLAIVKKRTYTLTERESSHLLNLLLLEKESGDYYGQREQYYSRTDRLIALLSDNEPEREAETTTIR